MRATSEDTERLMLSLGCAIRARHRLLPQDCDPEKQFLKALKYYWTSNSIFFLLYTSFYERLFPYIHVDRLVKIAKSSILSNDELCLLVAICENISVKDHRYKVAVKKLSIGLSQMTSPPKTERDAFLIKKYGEENSLKRFGVSVRSFQIKKTVKLLPLAETFKKNTWLRYRALFGSNTRSDCAFVLYNTSEDLSASAVARQIFSTRQAVSVYFKNLMMLKDCSKNI